MPFNVALADLVTPYLVRGENLGANHAPLSAIRVTQFETASAAFGMVIRGRCEFNGQTNLDVGQGRLSLQVSADALVNEGAPTFDPNRRAEIFDLRETALDFELLVPRVGSNIIAAGVDSINDDDFTPTRDVLEVWEPLPANPTPSDFPSSGFALDLILNAPTVRPPFFQPAQMTPEGLLVPDETYQEVSLTLPKLRFRFLHNNGQPNGQGSALQFQLLSAGVTGLDDPGDMRVAEVISMEPPYAFIGRSRDRTLGFAFRKAVLDLSNEVTPPAVIEKFGFGDDWGGLYLPEVRLFIAPEGARDFAFEAGVQDLLIGFGNHRGVSGDFDVALINQGDGVLQLGARFFDSEGNRYDIARLGDQDAVVRVPPQTRMVVDIQGGRAPYDCTVQINDGAASGPARLFDINLGDSATQDIDINVVDESFGTPISATLRIRAELLNEPLSLPAPSDEFPPAAQPATLTVGADDQPRIVVVMQNDREVWLTTEPIDPTLRWRVLNSDDPAENEESEASSIYAVQLAPGETKTVQARRPPVEVDDTTEHPFYFYFDEPEGDKPADEAALLGNYGFTDKNVWSTEATGPGRDRQPSGGNPLDVYAATLAELPSGSDLEIQGEASYENDPEQDLYNYLLARRRAIVVQQMIQETYPEKNFAITILPDPDTREEWISDWQLRDSTPQWWRATMTTPQAVVLPEQQATVTLTRPETPTPPAVIPTPDEPPEPNRSPEWFRSLRLKVRIVRDELVAGEIVGEIDLQTAAERKLEDSEELGTQEAPDIRTLQSGTPVGPDNPADGITTIRLLAQSDSATGLTSTLIELGADPADKDGIAMAGWLPGELPVSEDWPAKDFGRTLLGSYLSFWPLLVEFSDGENRGRVEEAVLTGAALALPGTVAALPWFQIERVILYGGEFLTRDRNGEQEAFFLFDVQMDWSVDIRLGDRSLIEIDPYHPLSVRYKAIGLRFGHRDSTDQFSLRPVFDASRGYTIDVAKNGALKVADPLGRILRVLAARISRSNPTTLEVDVGMSVDLGVIAIDRARVRVYLNGPENGGGIPRPELTALGARVDIPGGIKGQGYLEINDAGIAGEIDLTIVPINLRVSAALAMQQIDDETEGSATAVYVSLNVVLPVGIPLGASGLGIFGFRGIFGMHYGRNLDLGGDSAIPALAWLVAAEGQPHRLRADNGTELWTPQLDRWSFGLGILIGTIEGGVLMNLDGTFLLELPGPRIVIVMNARILSPPPSLEGLGGSGGILAIIEITPDHFLIGIIAEYGIPNLITLRIPTEAIFSFNRLSDWHIYLGSRIAPISVDVLGIVKGTGYLMFDGEGLAEYNGLPQIEGFAIGLGAAAAFVFGNVDRNLYLQVGGNMDAVVGFSPFILGGVLELGGELRLFIVSIGAHAKLEVLVREAENSDTLLTYIHGEACGHIRLFFFKLEGCVSVTIGDATDLPPIPDLVQKLSLKSRSPALATGTGVDRGIDTSLGDGLETANSDTLPDRNELITVPIDSIPILSLLMPVQDNGVLFFNNPIGGSCGAPAPDGPEAGFLPRGEEKYKYTLGGVVLERINPDSGQVLESTLVGSEAPATWWLLHDPSETNKTAQLALMTWEPTPATKAIEKNELLKESVENRWGQICTEGSPPASVLWTFRFEPLGLSSVGWDVEGIAWPDPDDTKRSSAPDTELRVTERWRSGDAILDNRRGITGASVVGQQVPCEGDDAAIAPVAAESPQVVVGGRGPVRLKSTTTVGQLVGSDDPVLTQLVRRPRQSSRRQRFRITPRLHQKVSQQIRQQANQPASSVGTADPVRRLVRRVAQNQAVTSAEVQATLLQPMEARALSSEAATQVCHLNLLQAPIFDDGRPIVFGNLQKQAEVAAALAQAGVTHGPLNDVVVLHTGPFHDTKLMLFAWTTVLKQDALIVRTLDAEGNELQRISVGMGDRLVVEKPLPERWIDPTGPWADDIDDLMAWAYLIATVSSHDQFFWLRGLVPVLVELPEGEQVDRIEIGVSPALTPLPGTTQPNPRLISHYFVAAVECLRGTEVARAEWDASQIERERYVIESVLGPTGTDNAFLHPDSVYRLRALWNGERQSDQANTGNQEQVFWFQTDHAPPARLDAWMLMTLPADGEQHVFGGEPLRLVFNTHDVQRLYEAYGHSLQIRLQAASANHPQPLPLSGASIQPAGSEVLSPWEATLEEVLSGACIPIDENRTRQSAVIVPVPLDPYTDYILDIEAVNEAADEGDPARTTSVYRRQFSTGAYPTVSDLAESLQAVKVSHRAVPLGSMVAIHNAFNGQMPQGAEFDEQWRAQGLEVMPVVEKPRIVVLWEQEDNALPQPTAVLVDAPEPLWRSRPYPTEITDESGPVPTQRWQLISHPWLELQESIDDESGPVVVPDGLIQAPGGQRTLVMLQPNSRGQRLRLDLVALGFDAAYLNIPEDRIPVVIINLTQAPWEEME